MQIRDHRQQTVLLIHQKHAHSYQLRALHRHTLMIDHHQHVLMRTHCEHRPVKSDGLDLVTVQVQQFNTLLVGDRQPGGTSSNRL
jgi:hypothetical protein